MLKPDGTLLLLTQSEHTLQRGAHQHINATWCSVLPRPESSCTLRYARYLSCNKCVQGTPVLLKTEGEQSHLEELLLGNVE